LLAPVVDVASAAVIIAEEIIPKRQPMLGVATVVNQQPIHEPLALVFAGIPHERFHLFCRWQQADDVEVNAAGEHTIAHQLSGLQTVRLKVWRQPEVNRVLQPGLSWRRRQWARMKIHRRLFGKADTGIPRHALIDPCPKQTDLPGRELRALDRHDVVGVETGDQLDEMALRALPCHGNRTRIAALQKGFAVIEPKPAFVLPAPVTLHTTGFEDGLDIALKADGFRHRRRQLRHLIRAQGCPDTPVGSD
jgi:hypothetical protein